MLRRDPAEAFAEADSSPVDPANYLKVSQLHRSDGDSTSGAAAGGLKLASRYIHEILGIPQFSHSFSNGTVRRACQTCPKFCPNLATWLATLQPLSLRLRATSALAINQPPHCLLADGLASREIRQRRRA